MHPLHHAKSSAKRFDTTVEACLPIHTFLDASKQAHSSFKHRYYRHHASGIADAVRHCHGALGIPEALVIDVATQHIKEDCGGVVPSVADYLAHYRPTPCLAHSGITLEATLTSLINRFGGEKCDYDHLLSFFEDDESRSLRTRTVGLAHRHHSFAIAEYEAWVGMQMRLSDTTTANKTAITRYVAEHLIALRLRNHRVPSLDQYAQAIKAAPFMAKNHVLPMV